jgi:hypothetical protein
MLTVIIFWRSQELELHPIQPYYFCGSDTYTLVSSIVSYKCYYNIWWPVPRYRVNNCLCLFSHFHLPPPWSSSTFSVFLALKVSTGMLSCQVQVWLYFSHHRSLLTSTKCFGSTVTLLLNNSGCCCLLSTYVLRLICITNSNITWFLLVL